MTEATSNATIYFSTSHNRWVIEAPDVYFEANTTHHSIGQVTDLHLNDGNDRRRFQGLNKYFGTNSWFQFSMNYGSKMVTITITCFDTRHPTLSPSVAPTTPAPTLAPTEMCTAVEVLVGAGGVKTYNGIYNKQDSTINGYDWWVARNDVGTTEATSNSTIYFSTSHNRWIIEASDVYFEANTTHHSIGQGTNLHLNDGNDRRRFQALSNYFGKNNWFQFSLNYGSKMVAITITCFDTRHPTLSPSVAPTTPAPTLAPTEMCTTIEVAVTGGVTTYDGMYIKQSTTINGYDWWVARNDVGGIDANTGSTIYFSTSHNRWIIEAPDVYWEANITQHSIGQGTDDHMNDGNDRRRSPGIEEYFGIATQWLQFSLTHGSMMVDIDIICYDTKEPTLSPSVAPTTPAPTLAPTEMCTAVEVMVGAGGVKTYNGIYNKQDSTINGYDWWVARNDIGITEATSNSTIYFSTSHNRWIIEAPDVYFEANMENET